MRKLMLLIALLVLLAGCGPTMPPTEMPTPVPTAGPTAEPNQPQLAAELHVFNWPEYIDPEVCSDFEAEYGIKVIEDTFGSSQELLAKLQAGATGYDIIVPSDYMVEIMVELDMLAPLNLGNIPNRDSLYLRFQDPPYDPGNTHCIPYQWGTVGIGYNADEFEDPPDSWAFLFDPDVASAYAGKISMLNDPRESIGAALKYLGYSNNSTNADELEQAKQLLLQQKSWVTTYDNEQYEDLLMSEDTVIALGWSGDFFMAAEEDERIWYIIPQEGTTVWTDNLCIPKTSTNQYTAELFIDFLLRPEIAAKISNFTRYASPVQAAEEFIDAEILEEPAIYPPPEVMAKLEWLEDVGEANALYDRIWTEVLAAEQ